MKLRNRVILKRWLINCLSSNNKTNHNMTNNWTHNTNKQHFSWHYYIILNLIPANYWKIGWSWPDWWAIVSRPFWSKKEAKKRHNAWYSLLHEGKPWPFIYFCFYQFKHFWSSPSCRLICESGKPVFSAEYQCGTRMWLLLLPLGGSLTLPSGNQHELINRVPPKKPLV